MSTQKITKADFYKKLRAEVNEIKANNFPESVSFLIWFLENYFRLDYEVAIDSVCDNKNDKGIDAIYTDDDGETVYIFQSKFSPFDSKEIGDVDLREFLGTKSWIKDQVSINNLLKSNANKDLKSLVSRLGLLSKTHYEVKLVFVTNKVFNDASRQFINNNNEIEAYDEAVIYERYTYFSEKDYKFPEIEVRLLNDNYIDYPNADGMDVKVFAIQASELVRLSGIQDRTLFSKNVRYGVGNTRVNKSIKDNIKKTTLHDQFFLFHNGITIVCSKLNKINDRITISDYQVINGCQSMITFYENRDELTADLFVLVKIIRLQPESKLVKDITTYANNQNSISLMDLRSNDSVQIELENEFKIVLGGAYSYERKRGQILDKDKNKITKDLAGQLILSVYKGKPYNTHLKQKIFDSDYTEIFSKSLTASKIIISKMLLDTVVNNIEMIVEEKIRSYGLGQHALVYWLACVLEQNKIGKQILEEPDNYLNNNLKNIKLSLDDFWSLIVPNINYAIKEFITEKEGFFDYKNVFKNKQFIESMKEKILRDYQKDINRNPDDSFDSIYAKNSNPAK